MRGTNVRSLHRLQIQREVDRLTAEARTVDQGAAILRAVDRGEAFDALAQLRGLGVEDQAEVGEEREGDLVDDRDAVLEVGGEVGIATDGREAIDRQRNRHVAQVRLCGIARHGRAVRIGELEVHLGRDERVGRAGTNVEAADFVLAAAIDTSERRRHLAAETGDVREQ